MTTRPLIAVYNADNSNEVIKGASVIHIFKLYYQNIFIHHIFEN